MQCKLARHVTFFGPIRVQVLRFCAGRHHKCSELGELGIGWDHISQGSQHPTHCCPYRTTSIAKQ